MSGDVSSAHAAPGSPGEDAWHRLRVCESGENYAINSGNGYYGAYQFSLGTWRGVGGAGLPSQAAPIEQDYRARLLYRERGWSPWGCARILGLRDDPIYGEWVAPATIRVTSQFTVGHAVTVSGTAAGGAWVRVYAKGHGEAEFRTVANVQADRTGRWSWATRPSDDTYFAAASGGVRTASVLARAVFAVTMSAPTSSTLGVSYTLSGAGRPGGTVRVYIKPHYMGTWLGSRVIRVDGGGHWSTVWRATTDFTFAARGDVAGPVRMVPVRTTAQATVASGPAGVRTVAGVRGSIHGTARPNTEVMIYTRAPGAAAWRPFKLVRANAAGQWSAPFTSERSFEYQAKAGNGQASPVDRVTAA
ncbi:MAG: transglycosylase family protein [Actinobacteria bacterium]|nr:transglycosylase family protein [Actinomycetota bacterium]MBI3686463.1 transglycosylase family protein [Actinomycetota bacterium]